MRSLWLASAAFMISAGIACAQTQGAAPAPNGAASAPVETTPGNSPGKTAPPASDMQGQNSMAPMGSNMGAPAPAPNGAANAPQETPAGASPGKTAPASAQSHVTSTGAAQTASTAAESSTTTPAHHWHHGAALPAEGSASEYLRIAKAAIRHHDTARAEDALSHAETRMLTRSVPQAAAIPVDDSPAVTDIEHARAALRAGDLQEAANDTDMALHEAHHGMMEQAGSTAP